MTINIDKKFREKEEKIVHNIYKDNDNMIIGWTTREGVYIIADNLNGIVFFNYDTDEINVFTFSSKYKTIEDFFADHDIEETEIIKIFEEYGEDCTITIE